MSIYKALGFLIGFLLFVANARKNITSTIGFYYGNYNEFPHMLALGWNLSDGNKIKYICGGVLISKNFGLTAAHCAYAENELELVLPGGVDLSNMTVPTVGIKEIIVHPEYDLEFSYNDIAVIVLETAIDKETVYLWTQYEVPDTENLVAMGYGTITFAGKHSDSLLKVYVNIMSNEECQKFFQNDVSLPNGIISTQLCTYAYKNYRDTCHGDSGGPLVNYDRVFLPRYEAQQFIVGIISYGTSCSDFSPTVYTRVSEYIDWIQEVIRSEKNRSS